MKTKLELRIKQGIYIILFIVATFDVWAQEEIDKSSGHNEFKINMGSLLLEFPEFSYEHILNEESSIGVSLAFPLDSNISYKFMVFPNFRMFFGSKPVAGFFIEANSAIFSQRLQNQALFGTVTDESTNKTAVGFGLGLAIGGKFLTKNGFIGEIYLGGGRNFINTNKIDEGYPRVGISIGKRF